MINFLLTVLSVFALYISIAIIWQVSEKIIYGQVTPRVIDDVVAIVLAISLYFNMK